MELKLSIMFLPPAESLLCGLEWVCVRDGGLPLIYITTFRQPQAKPDEISTPSNIIQLIFVALTYIPSLLGWAFRPIKLFSSENIANEQEMRCLCAGFRRKNVRSTHVIKQIV